MPVTKTLLLRGYKTGVAASLTLNVTSYTGATAVQSALPATETAVGSGCYTFALTAVVTTQTYGAQLLRNAVPIGNFAVDLSEVAAIYPLVDEPTVSEIAAAVNASGGSGINTITFTITDNIGNLVQFLKVSAFSGSSFYSGGTTDVNGHVSLFLNNGGWTITLGGLSAYVPASHSLTVTAPASVPYTVQLQSITPSTPPNVTGFLICLDNLGNPEANVVFYVSQIGITDGATGAAFSKTPVSVQSDDTGLVQVTNQVPGAAYFIQRGTNGTQVRYTAADVDFELPDCLG